MLFDGDNQEIIHKSAQAWYELSDLWHSILSLVCYRYWGTRVMLTEAEWCNLHMLVFLRRLSALRLAARNKRNAELSVFLCRYRKMGDIIGSRFKSSPRIWCWKKTHTKTKQNLTHVKCCSWDMKSFSPTYCVSCCSEDIATSQDVPEKKNIIGCFLNFQCHDTSFLWILTNGYWLCSINYIIKDGSFV